MMHALILSAAVPDRIKRGSVVNVDGGCAISEVISLIVFQQSEDESFNDFGGAGMPQICPRF